MTTEFLASTPITNLDATPIVVPTTGEGLPGDSRTATDSLVTTTAGGVGSTYRLCRFPTCAKVKRVRVYIGDVDANAVPTWAADVNVAFSDSTVDGTTPANQGTIPTTANNGTTTTVAAYTNPNKLFGSVSAAASGATKEVDVTFNGSFVPANRDTPLWNVFGFVTYQGVAYDPGGYFDLLLYVSAAAATAHAGTLGAEIDFVM